MRNLGTKLFSVKWLFDFTPNPNGQVQLFKLTSAEGATREVL